MYYAIHEPFNRRGVYDSWTTMKQFVCGVKGAKYKKFEAVDDATIFARDGGGIQIRHYNAKECTTTQLQSPVTRKYPELPNYAELAELESTMHHMTYIKRERTRILLEKRDAFDKGSETAPGDYYVSCIPPRGIGVYTQRPGCALNLTLTHEPQCTGHKKITAMRDVALKLIFEGCPMDKYIRVFTDIRGQLPIWIDDAVMNVEYIDPSEINKRSPMIQARALATSGFLYGTNPTQEKVDISHT